jgi:hypothetical protein
VFEGEDLLDLPAHFAGRNLPDISLNADPETGYLLLSTEDGGLLDGYRGTSFVAPQLNGISALMSQAIGGRRIGLWNPMLYRFKQVYGYSNASPFVDITAGDNWWHSRVRTRSWTWRTRCRQTCSGSRPRRSLEKLLQ